MYNLFPFLFYRFSIINLFKMFSRSHIVNQFNDGLYDYLIASDETMMEVPESQITDEKETKPKQKSKR